MFSLALSVRMCRARMGHRITIRSVMGVEGSLEGVVLQSAPAALMVSCRRRFLD